MNRVGIFNCPPVKINDYVEVVYQCNSIKDESYYKRVRGKVIYVNGDFKILLELPQNFKKVGNIKGWIPDEQDERNYGCSKKKLYWWIKTYRKIGNILDIE